MAVAMELATALHHSAQFAGRVVAGPREMEEQDKYEASRRQKAPPPGAHPGVLKEREVQVRAASVGYVAAGAPSLSVVLVSDMMHDDATVQYLLKQSLLARQAELDRRKRRVEEEEKKAKEKEEEKELEQARRELRTLLAVPAPRRTAEQETRVRACRSVLGAAYKRKRKKRRKKKTPLLPLPILRFAALIVDNGSGMCWLVLLVTILLVLCFRLLSMPFAIPQVQFLVKVICPLLSCLVVLVRQCRELWILRSCSPSLAVNIPFRAANADPHGPVCSADNGDSTVAAYFGGRCSCCRVVQILGCCRGEAIGAPTVAARREICGFLRPFVFGSHLFGVRLRSTGFCTFLSYDIRKRSRTQRLLVQHWIHVCVWRLWKIFNYFLRQGGAVNPRISAQCLVRQWIHAWRRDMYSAGIAGDNAPRAVFFLLVRWPMMLGIMAGMVQMDSCSGIYGWFCWLWSGQCKLSGSAAVPQLQFFGGRHHPGRGALASLGPDCSSDQRDSPVAREQQGDRCPCCAVLAGFTSRPHLCRDVEADPHGLVDHGDSALASGRGGRCPVGQVVRVSQVSSW